jgi:hypothetical protein
MGRLAGLEGLPTLVAELRAEVAELSARAGQNSKDSSRPQSSDGLAKAAPKVAAGKPAETESAHRVAGRNDAAQWLS